MGWRRAHLFSIAVLAAGPALACAPLATAHSLDTAELRRLALGLEAASPADHDRARAHLLRPSGPVGDVAPHQRYPDGEEAAASPACTDLICVHWTDRGGHAPKPADLDGRSDLDGVPDYVEQVLEAVRRSVKVENRELGWRRARADGRLGEVATKGGGRRADIYLLDLGSRIAGFTAVDPGGKGRQRSGWVAIDNDFSEQGSAYLTLLKVTIAHEYNHLLQYAYDFDQEPWLYESAATWIEDRVFPEANLYLGFVRDFAQAPGTPLGSPKTMYGAATLHQFVSAQAAPKLVRQVWETAHRFRGRGRSYRALDAGLERGGLDASALYGRFAAATAAWRDHPAFPDGSSFAAVHRSAPVGVGKGPSTVELDRMSFAIVPVEGLGPPSRLSVRVKGPRHVKAFAGLVTQKGTAIGIDRVSALDDGDATLELKRPKGVESVEVVVADVDFRRDRGKRRYRGDHRRFLVAAR